MRHSILFSFSVVFFLMSAENKNQDGNPPGGLPIAQQDGPPGGLHVCCALEHDNDELDGKIEAKLLNISRHHKPISVLYDIKHGTPDGYELNETLSMCFLPHKYLVQHGYYGRHVTYLGTSENEKPDTRTKFHIRNVCNSHDACHLLRSMVVFETSDCASIEWWHQKNEQEVVYEAYLWDKTTQGGWSIGKKAQNHTFTFLKGGC